MLRVLALESLGVVFARCGAIESARALWYLNARLRAGRVPGIIEAYLARRQSSPALCRAALFASPRPRALNGNLVAANRKCGGIARRDISAQ